MLYYKTILAAATLGLASSFSSPIIAITQSGVTTRSAVHLQFGNAVRTTPCITSPVLLLRRHIYNVLARTLTVFLLFLHSSAASTMSSRKIWWVSTTRRSQ